LVIGKVSVDLCYALRDSCLARIWALAQICEKKAMKLTDHIHLLKIDFEISIAPGKKFPRFVNVLLIFGEKITLIDTGVKGSEKVIFDYIEKQGRDIEEIDAIVLSHAHPDHIGSAAAIKKQTGCKVIAHPLESAWVEDIVLQHRERPVPGFFDLVDEPTKVDHFAEDQQTMKVGKSITIKFFETPGHSGGSLSMLFIEDRIFFTADSIPLKNDIPTYDNYRQLMQSLEKIRAVKEYDVLLTSWTPAITDMREAERLIEEGEIYMRKIDEVVHECYNRTNSVSLENCRRAIDKLGLSSVLANLLADRAFRSHLL